MKTVFLFIPNFIYSSDLLRTEYIQYLSTKYRVIVFALPEILHGGKPYPKLAHATYIPWELYQPKFWILFGDFLRNPLIRKYDFEPVIRKHRNRGYADWRRKVMRMIGLLVPSGWITPELFTALEVRFLPKCKKFTEYVQKYQPVLSITPTPGFTHYDAQAVILAKQNKIPTVCIDFSWDNLHNGGIHFRRVDYMIVWTRIIKDIAVREYLYPDDHVFVSGIIRFDKYFQKQSNEPSREAFLNSKGLDPAEKTILLTTVTAGNYDRDHILLEDLIEARAAGKFSGYPNIFVRLHPKEEIDKFKKFMDGSSYKNFHIETAGKDRNVRLATNVEMEEDDLLNTKYTLMYSDVVINYRSTMSLEAMIFDKPVINIYYPEKYRQGYLHRHYEPILHMHAVALAGSFDEMVAQINEYLAHPACDREGRTRVLDEYVRFRDMYSYKRSVDFLDSILK
ncbi:MAG: hypothetical protein G01um101448_97 [Parcubacteria group bacterium Gr01-1014_48]|nr:MAG: hypothetical protein Greene041614_18 [Parcubacteria group bacterium Greene0416_14]TSC74456.1 MAG: hypothetical protein G01um101448_97 [Parcubacteria group bacterium Gr01-1014_48]TSD01766.1 MAG: hypothetical protein Greene101415_24 [Parcubacteria group bacterium Greene1014_15]TSD08480.1 MAG: hypothetical protein Greene07144_19 [Parcubacteria group bacterium Greene0714_4]